MTATPHHCRLLAFPWPGVHATVIDSARHDGRHWHATYGLGLMDEGAHRSSSSTGSVEAFAGDIVTTNPGEVHDGRPLGGPSRRWRTVYLEPEVLASIHAEGRDGDAGDIAFTRAAFHDPLLQQALHARRWTHRQGGLSAVREATTKVLVVAEALHATAGHDVPRLVQELAAALQACWGVRPQVAVLAGASTGFTFPSLPGPSP